MMSYEMVKTVLFIILKYLLIVKILFCSYSLSVLILLIHTALTSVGNLKVNK